MPALYEQFFLFGDSITQDSFDQTRGFGFSAALQAAYIRKLDVVNRGQSGYNTRQALHVLPALIPSPEQAKIRFLLVFFGANDASLPDASNKQHIPLDEYKSNIERIITHPQVVAHNPRVLLIAPPPVNEHLWWPRDQASGYPSITRLASATKDYAEAACEVGAKLNVPVVNLWQAFMDKAAFQKHAWKSGDPLPGSLGVPQNDALVELMYDGLHFNPAGYDVFFQALMGVIAREWPDQTPDKLPIVLPAWNDPEAWKLWGENVAGAERY
ncbi:SGNH hydrolase-type esterase domain-containing protein [Ampelomyces quisqualis]|uniref:SGNH hydrolase-type esterase domain-containing protein n=1 Tax=Ampelomyces quisqualis TaxID=50730 RepID=A0A6A5QP23_AMPQU|nr:SGNH hydrolase-type esterase domain-containing protein [Ampelomyces quisqualis]